MSWDKQRRSKEERLNAAAALCNGKTVATENIVKLMEAVIHPGDKVVLEGDNQKQAAFLAASLAEVDPKVIHDLTMIIPSISRSEHLDYFEKGIAGTVDFAFAGTQAQRLSEMLAEGKVKIGNFNTYLEIYARLFVDLIPNVCLVAADKADKDGNLFTGYSTEETPTLVEAAACKSGIVIAQVNEIVEDLPRVDIPGGWVDFIVPADKPYPMEPLFTRDPQFIKDADILMGMMVIKGIYAKHGVQSLNHGIGFNGAAIELLLPTYGEQLGLKGKICRNWVLNPHPTLIPAPSRRAGSKAFVPSAAKWAWKNTPRSAAISSLPVQTAPCAATVPWHRWRGFMPSIPSWAPPFRWTTTATPPPLPPAWGQRWHCVPRCGRW